VTISDPQRAACIECDLLVEIAALAPGERAACPRCGHIITRQAEDSLDRCLAYAIAAAVLLIMSNTFPFLSLQASGLEKVMTLPHSAVELYNDGYASLAVLVLGPIVGIPAIMLATLLAMLVTLRGRASVSWLVPAGKLVFFLNPWSMAEVFVIGVLVSLVKIGAMATVVPGISFFAYIGFTLCFTACLSNLDRYEFWRYIEARIS
jgi:paraquat-inducible protein A